MDPAQALADLIEISSQIQVAVLFDPSGEVIASTLVAEERSRRLARAAGELLAAAGEVSTGTGGGPPTQLEAATSEGSVFLVRDGERVVVATTSPDPTVGLVFYDLKSCLRSVAAGESRTDGNARPRRKVAKQAEGSRDDAGS